MPIISVAIQKGGSGKTTTAINLAAALTKMGNKVLLVDFDPQANLTQALGLSQELDENVYTQIQKQAAGKTVKLNDIIQSSGGLSVVPAALELANAELELVSVYGREKLLSQLLKPLKNQYDYIFIDCPPAIGMLTVNALAASDYVLMPLQAEFLPLKGVESFLKTFETVRKQINKKVKLVGFVFTKFDPRKQMNRQVAEKLEAQYSGKVFDAHVRTNIALAKSQEKGQHIFDYDTTANGAMDYMELAQEFLKKVTD